MPAPRTRCKQAGWRLSVTTRRYDIKLPMCKVLEDNSTAYGDQWTVIKRQVEEMKAGKVTLRCGKSN